MNIALWIVQILLALAFAMAGIMKVTQPIDRLETRMGWVKDVGPRGVRLIGSLEILGAIGLILPAVTGILPWLTPVAAVGFVCGIWTFCYCSHKLSGFVTFMVGFQEADCLLEPHHFCTALLGER